MKFRIIVLYVAASIFALFGTISRSACAQDAVPDSVWENVDKIFGKAGKDLPGEVRKYSWPRSDLKVRIGDVQIEPALALGSWAAFHKSGEHDRVMAMGDLVLTETEVNPVITELQSGGLKVLAIHNHLIHESPKVIYIHFSGEEEADAIAKTLKEALGKTKTPLRPSETKTPTGPSPSEQEIFRKIQNLLGHNGTMSGKVLQISVPRAEKIETGGVEVFPSMGTGMPLNFQAVGERIATTGDFVLLSEEVNPVIQELRLHGIEMTALHSHMLSESPRLFFLHFWGVDTPEKIAEGLEAALAKVKTK